MSEHRTLFPALLLAFSASSLGAQQGVASLQARRAELTARAESLRVEVDRLRRAEQDSGVVANVKTGALHLRTTRALAPLAEVATAQAQQIAAKALGPDAEGIERRLTLILRENRSRVQWRSLLPLGAPSASEPKERMTSAALNAALDGKELPGVTLYAPVTKDDLADGVLAVLEQASASALPPALSAWAGNRVPLRDPAPELWPDIYRAMATADAAVVRHCVAGDRGACRLAFAIDSVPANRLASWYDESDLPGLARNAGDHIQRSTMTSALSAEERDECIERHNLDICRRMLAYLPADAYAVPMPLSDRAYLVSLALRTGGGQAITRLGTATGNVAQQLSAAAGVSADSLVALWQQRLLAARPSSPLPGAAFVLASLACIAVCVAVAARGQPWR